MSLLAGLPGEAETRRALERLDGWLRSQGVRERVLESLPRVADPAQALVNLEELVAGGEELPLESLESLLRVLGASQALATTLRRLGANSLREVLDVERVEAREIVAADTADRPLETRLRSLKRRHFLRIGARDLLGLATVEDTVRELSSLADAAIEIALRGCRIRLREEYGAFPEAAEPRFVVLAMGKLGAAELNFSSDVDLVYLYDGADVTTKGGPRGRLDTHAWAARLAEGTTRMLQDKTEDGFVFRVDLRLRPHGQNGPVVNSLPAALLYYESWGQPWERGAMLKARAAAGDLALGEAFLNELVPFVFRRYLDFETLEEIQEMKERVHREHSRARLELDVKLGPGGIREVEFVAQALQLVHSGRDERLRVRPTLTALARLAQVDLLPKEIAEALGESYRFLRNVEHKIQIVHERQTQSLPADEEGMRRLARRLGFFPGEGESPGDETRRFRETLDAHRGRVHAEFQKLFFAARDEGERRVDAEVLTLLERIYDADGTASRLATLGFREPATACRNLQAILTGSGGPVSPRRRRALRELAPLLFAEVRRSADPDRALHQLAGFVAAVGARTSFLALLRENPETLRLLVSLFASSYYLSSFFLRHPELLDSLVRADVARVRKQADELRADLVSQLASASDFEANLDTLRRFRNEEFLRVGVNDIHRLLDHHEVEEQLSDLAEVCLEAALSIAASEIEERHGSVPGRFTVVALGKLGGRELNYNSDLDLIYLYDAGSVAGDEMTAHEVSTRLAQRLMAVLQTNTREGTVYKIDTRLRPSGSSGALVSSLEAFRRYHETSSAVWERQALVRGRAVAGNAALGRDFEAVREEFVFGRGLTDDETAEIARLRVRMEEELAGEGPERWNLKTGRGGSVDVEFLVQILQLQHGHEHPSVRSRKTREALRALEAAGLLPADEARCLGEGHEFLRRLENRLRIERDQPVEALAHEQAGALALQLDYVGSPEEAGRALLADVSRVRESIRSVYAEKFR